MTATNPTPYRSATRAEVEALKRDWAADPCFEITGGEGFEAYRDELAEFAATQQAGWERRRTEHLAARAEHFGCPGNLKLAAYIEKLEEALNDRIDNLETRMARQEGRK